MTLKHKITQKLRQRLAIAPPPLPGLSRNFLAETFIIGQGVEIGALHNPLTVNTAKATVKYVDRMTVEDLRKQYPELNDKPLVQVDYVADGELLESVPDGSQDFVIGNHFIEHCQNPILAIRNMIRVLKPGGAVFLAVPDKRYTFDILRPPTTIEHFRADYEQGPQISKEKHFWEWVTMVQRIEGEEARNTEYKRLLDMDYSIHFHVWEKSDMDNFLHYLIKNMKFDFEVVVSLRVERSNENVFILRKNEEDAPAA